MVGNDAHSNNKICVSLFHKLSNWIQQQFFYLFTEILSMNGKVFTTIQHVSNHVTLMLNSSCAS